MKKSKTRTKKSKIRRTAGKRAKRTALRTAKNVVQTPAPAQDTTACADTNPPAAPEQTGEEII